MPRKKTAKRSPAKKIRSVKKTKTLVTSHEAMEQQFKSIPAKIIAQYQKAIALLKSQEQKLTATLKKAEAQYATTQKKLAALLKTKASPNKKQLNALKQATTLLTKTIKDIWGNITQIQKNIHSLADKQKKFTAMRKELARWEKNWKSTPFKAAARPLKKTKRKKTATTRKPAATNPTFNDEHAHENQQTTLHVPVEEESNELV